MTSLRPQRCRPVFRAGEQPHPKAVTRQSRRKSEPTKRLWSDTICEIEEHLDRVIRGLCRIIHQATRVKGQTRSFRLPGRLPTTASKKKTYTSPTTTGRRKMAPIR